MHELIHVIEETLLDFLRLFPFLFITYLVLEFIEHKAEERMTTMMRHSGPWGPVIGSALGIIPQCGFSASASNLYAQRIISAGTLLAVFLSTSDEMLPILISEEVPVDIIIKILLVKFSAALIIGLLVDIVIRPFRKAKNEVNIHETMCDPEGCNCDEDHGILVPAIRHTLNISVYVIAISFVLNFAVHTIDEEILAELILNKPVIGPIIAAVVGFVPNCASSIIITQLFLEGAMSTGAMLAGLLAASGMGVLILFRVNRRQMRENFVIVFILFVSSVLTGILTDLLNISLL